MRRFFVRLVAVTLMACLMVLGGCFGSKPSRFYVLTPLPSSERLPQIVGDQRDLAIGIGPVALPRYLDRPEVVTHASQNQLNLAKFDQWAEPLQGNFTRVLAENIANLLSTDRIAIDTWPRSTQPAYQVVVNVTRFEGKMGGNSFLTARWSILAEDGQEELMMSKSSFNVPADTQEYEAMVAAMSRALGELSRDIAVALRAIAQSVSTR